MHTLTHKTRTCDMIRKEAFAGGKKDLKMKLYWMRVGPKSNAKSM